jgi:hypothetical protein
MENRRFYIKITMYLSYLEYINMKITKSWLVYPWYLSNKCNQEETIKQFKGNQTVYYVWERRMLFVLSVCTSQNCTCKSSYILNGNSLKQ